MSDGVAAVDGIKITGNQATENGQRPAGSSSRGTDGTYR